MRSIRRYLLCYLLAAMSAIGLLTFAAAYYSAKHEVEELYDAELAQYARIVEDLVDQSWMQLADNGRSTPPVHWPTQMEAFGSERTPLGHRYERKLAVQIWSVDRHLLMRTSNAPATPFIAFESGYQQRELADGHWHVFSLVSPRTGRWIMAGERGDVRDEIIRDLTLNALLPYLIGLPVLLLLSALLIRRALRPLTQLSEQLRGRDSRSLAPVILDETALEILPVTEALNALLQDLVQSFAREQRLTADAAHELRTPLTVLALHARNALEAQNEPDRELALHRLEAGIARSRRLLEQLLTYAQVNRQEELARTRVNLAEVARSAIAELYPLLLQRQQTISLQEEGSAGINGQSLLLETLICNLIDNASRYSPAGSTIEVRLVNDGAHVLLEVHDSGSGIPAAERQRVLQPYQRLNSGDGQGAGLGLAIVQGIVQWHGASLDLGDSTLGGLRVSVRFMRYSN